MPPSTDLDDIDDPDGRRTRARAVLEAHWRDADGYTVPHAGRYPFQWLWDSCFHAIAWARLGDERALRELASVFRWQTPKGFVPHVGYQADPHVLASFWGRTHASTITQPPMYGHAVAELTRLGFDVPDELRDRAVRGIGWLLEHRRRGERVVLCHPWESGCDDSPQWDRWCEQPWTPAGWYACKGAFVQALVVDDEGAAVANPAFEDASLGFNALVAFNAAELGLDAGLDLDGPADPATLDELLVTLLGRRLDLLDVALDPAVFGGACGPAFVRRDHPAFDPVAYWRGSAWPQLTYLLWVAARDGGRAAPQAELARRALDGARASGLAEHWHPDTGAPLGAVPQSWTTLALLLADAG
jgi:hypothetical protein